ncbi:GxxExxY protein [Candidatus Poribacteria bacterium]|nr:GxxExxY protein [Candidatus Poribacteria bacterium]
MDLKPISEQEEQIASALVDSAYAVHTALGPGWFENVYAVCFCHELTKRGLSYRRQVMVPIVYDNITFAEGFRLDVLVEALVICDLKAVEQMNPVFIAQLLTQVKLTRKRLGFLLNFNVPKIKDGIKRVVL